MFRSVISANTSLPIRRISQTSLFTASQPRFIHSLFIMDAPTRHGQGQGQGQGQDRRRRRPANRGRRNQRDERPQNGAPAKSQGFHTSAQPLFPDVPQAALTEAAPQDTPRFADLAQSNATVHQSLLDTIVEDLKFDHMMPVQAATLEELLPPKRSDCLVQAKTGTGKTMAFLLPAVQTMISQNRPPNNSGISLLVISPTRELAMQIAKEATNLLQRLNQYRVCIAIGGTNKDREEKEISRGCNILIATPGRLLDHLESSETVTHRLRHLDTLVLDEADRLLDMGFKKEIKKIVSYLPDKKEVNRQGMLFSATIPPHVQEVAGLVCSPNHKFISTIPEGELNTHERVPQLLIKVPDFSSAAPALVGAVRQEAAQTPNFKAIVFTPTAVLADFYAHILGKLPGLPSVSSLHSRLSQSKRTKITNEYRTAKSGILVATDVIARGMDFPNVTTVIQVGIPSDKESYIHRLGRTARASAEGRGLFIVSEAEEWFPKWSLKEIDFIAHDADLSSAPEALSIAAAMEESEKARIYSAWMGYYKNHLKPFKWTSEQLVAEANNYARKALGSPDTPPIPKSTASKMGLRGVRGLNTVPDPPRQPRNGGGRGGGGGGGGKRGGKA